jgi:hypothetical protein
MDDRTVVLVMTQGIGANLTNDEKRSLDRYKTRAPHRTGVPAGNPYA